MFLSLSNRSVNMGYLTLLKYTIEIHAVFARCENKLKSNLKGR